MILVWAERSEAGFDAFKKWECKLSESSQCVRILGKRDSLFGYGRNNPVAPGCSMVDSFACPDNVTLAKLLMGKLDDSEAEQLESHFAGCSHCGDTVRGLKLNDTLMDALRSLTDRDGIPSPEEVAPLIERGKSLSIESASRTIRKEGREASAVSSPPLLGQLGHYELLSLLGRGGMGAVYRARHEKLDRIVALKVLPADRLKESQAVGRFEREMRAVGKLQHPHIVAAHDAGEIDGTHYLVMELIDGVDLGAMVKSLGALPIPEACELVRQAALGLQHAHEHNLIHRDIKPSNLMLTRPTANHPPLVKILDMGLALLDEGQIDGQEELTSTGQVMGTVDYMAPEQGSDTHSVDIRADIYSLGATLFKLLTGRAPFASDRNDTVVKKLVALTTQPAPDVRTLRPDCPPKLAQLIQRLLSKNPQERPTPPGALADLLAPFARGADLVALQVATTGGAPIISSPSQTHTARSISPHEPTIILGAETQESPPPRFPYRWGLIASGFLGAAALLAGFLLRLETSAGTIVIRSDSPDIAGAMVTIDGHQQITISTAGESEPIQIKADKTQHSLRVTKGGFETFTKAFRIKSGQREVIEVALVPAVEKAKSVGKAVPVPREKPVSGPNQLTLREQQAGWKLLFDGKSTAGWRNYQKQTVSPKWIVKDGALTLQTSKSDLAGDIVTTDEYENFELLLDYNVTPGANSGVMFHVTETQPRASMSSAEVQIIDNAVAGGSPKSGWLWSLYQPDNDPRTGQPVDATRPPGEWNRLYLRIAPGNCEVRLNGVHYLSFVPGGEDWNQRVAKTRFAKLPDFGKATRGPILLQDYGDVISFRNIKIRELKPGQPFWTPEEERLISNSASAPVRAIPAGAVQYGERYYKAFPEVLSWHDAKKRCADLGGQMVTIRSAPENQFVAHLVKNAGLDATWLGATDEAQEGNWHWIDGKPLTFANWYQGQPNNKQNQEHYALLWVSQNALWCDQPDKSVEHRPGFVCTWDGNRPAASSSASDPNRTLATAVLNTGGWVDIVATGDSAFNRVNKIENLGPEPFVVRIVNISKLRGSQSALAKTFDFPSSVSCIDISQSELTDADLMHFAAIDAHHFYLASPYITDASAPLFAGWRRVRQFALWNAQVGEEICKAIASWPVLNTLDLAHSSVTDTGLAALSRSPSLCQLNLRECNQVTAKGLEALQQLPCLRWLILSTTNLGDEVVAPLSRIKQLQIIELGGTKVTDEGARRLQAALPDAFILHPATKNVSTEREVIEWALRKQAKVSYIWNDPDKSAAREIEFENNSPPAAEAEYLSQARCVYRLRWKGLKDADAATENIARMRSLWSLELLSSDLTGKGLARLAPLSRQLQTLTLSGSQNVNDDALKQLPYLPLLSELRLDSCPITGAGLEGLQQCPNLQGLVLHHGQVKSVNLHFLNRLPYLRYLDLSGSKDIHDAALEALAGCRGMQHLILSHTSVTKEGIRKLAAVLPGCLITWDGGTVTPSANAIIETNSPSGTITNAAPPASQTVDVDREVAKKILDAGGGCGVFFRDEKRGQGNLSPQDPLSDRPFLIYALSLPGQALTSELLEQLPRLRTLYILNLGGELSDPALLTHLSRLPLLKDLHLAAAQLQDRDVAPLEKMSRLPWLLLSHDVVQRTTVLPKLKSLETLQIVHGDDTDLKRLADCPQLRTIVLLDGTVSEAAVAELQSKNPRVRVILHSGTTVRGVGRDPTHDAVRHLLTKGVQFVGTPWPFGHEPKHLLTVEALETAPPMTISSVRISPGVELSDEDLVQFKTIRIVNGWFLQSLPNVDRFLDVFLRTRQTRCESLYLERSHLTPANLQQLKEMSWLSGMNLFETGLSREQVDSLRKSLPYTEIRCDYGNFAPRGGELPAEVSHSVDPDRAAAEWVLSRGDAVEARLGDGKLISLKKGELPNESFFIESVTLQGTCADEDLARLSLLTKIKRLYLSHASQVSDEGVKSLVRLKSLEVLSLGQMERCTEAGWATLNQLDKLQFLDLYPCQLPLPQIFHAIGTVPPQLKMLSIYQPLDDKALLEMGLWPRLEELLLFAPTTDSATLSSKGLSHLAKAAPNLKNLHLPLGDAAAARTIQEFPSLERLSWNADQLTPPVVAELAQCQPLRELNLGDFPPLDCPFQELTQLKIIGWWNGTKNENRHLVRFSHPGIERVTLQNCQIDGSISPFLKGFPNVKEVFFWNVVAFSSTDVETLVHQKSLKSLILAGPSEPIAPYLNQIRTRRPDIKIAGPGVPKTPAFPAISPMPSALPIDVDREVARFLQSLGGNGGLIIENSNGSHEEGNFSPDSLLPEKPFFIYLARIPGQKFTESVIAQLVRLKHLSILQVKDNLADPDALSLLSRLPNVRYVSFYGTRLEGVDLTPLWQLPYLYLLTLPHDALQKMQSFPELKFLNTIRISNGNDDDLRLLANCSSLRDVALINGVASEAAVAELQVKNPHVRVIIEENNASHGIGRDPTHEAVQRLLKKGVRIEGGQWPQGHHPFHFLTLQELETAPPMVMGNVTIPAGVTLDQDDLAALENTSAMGLRIDSSTQLKEELDCLIRGGRIHNDLFLNIALTADHVEQLRQLPWLLDLNIAGTGLSREQVDSLRKSLPYAEIRCDYGNFAPRGGELPAEASHSVDPDRAAAEWVLSMGGSISLTVNRTTENLALAGNESDRLPTEQFQVTSVSLAKRHSLQNSDLQRLIGLPKLATLFLDATPIDKDALPFLARMTSLRTLYIASTQIRSSELEQLANLKALSSLSMNSGQIDDGGQSLREIPGISTLFMSAWPDELRKIGPLPHIRRFFLWKAPDPELEIALDVFMKLNPQARILFLKPNGWWYPYGRDVTLELAQRLESSQIKMELRLLSGGGEPQIPSVESAAGRAFLIREIAVPPGTALNQQDRDLLSGISQLHIFRAPSLKQADLLATSLSQYSDLRLFDVPGSDLTDAGLLHLAQIPSLTMLNVPKTAITRAGVESFRKSVPTCSINADFGKFPPRVEEQPTTSLVPTDKDSGLPSPGGEQSATSLLLPVAPSSLPAISVWPEMNEPPLEEWLKGREVLTVKQDGTAMFKNIQTALNAQKPGQVVRILDKGPYRESLHWKEKTNCGLVTDQRTVVEVDRWSKADPNTPEQIGHLFERLVNCRLAGFTFLFQLRNPDERNPVQFWATPGMCCEDCVVAPVGPQLDSLIPKVGIYPRANLSTAAPMTVRRCLFLIPAMITVRPTDRVLFTRNWLHVRRTRGWGTMTIAGSSAANTENICLEQNVFTSKEASALVKLLEQDGALRLQLKHNTFSGEFKSPVQIVGPLQHLAVEDTLNLTPRNSIVFSSEAQTSIASARQSWTFHRNYGIGTPLDSMSEIPLGEVNTTQNIRVLSSNPFDRNYLRVDPASITLPEGSPFPGALPPGPAPAEGDWLTRLQDRWSEIRKDLQ